MATYNNYVIVYSANMTSNMDAKVVFAYNTSIDSNARTCTITGCLAIKNYKNTLNWATQTTPSGYCVQHWFYSNSTINCNGNNFTKTTHNSDLGHSSCLITVPGVTSAGGDYYNSGWSSNTWYGGLYRLTDDVSFTLPYGDNTSPSFTISGMIGGRSSWSAWFEPTYSATLTLPYLENHSFVYKSTNNGTNWNKSFRVYKTTNGGTSWDKADVYKTTNNGSNWYKI